MAEFEAERRMPAEAEQVFAIVGDLDRLSEWMPTPIGVRPTGDGEVHADVEAAGEGGQSRGDEAVADRDHEGRGGQHPDLPGQSHAYDVAVRTDHDVLLHPGLHAHVTCR